jgi:AhpD family alkylhydroperoxidase
MFTDNFQELTRQVNHHLAQMRESGRESGGIPDTMAGFSTLAKAALAPGAIDAKTKELIALAIGVAVRCDDCLGFHAKALVKLGATVAEVREMLGVAIYMGGGPSLMYAAHAQAAFEEFSGAGKT